MNVLEFGEVVVCLPGNVIRSTELVHAVEGEVDRHQLTYLASSTLSIEVQTSLSNQASSEAALCPFHARSMPVPCPFHACCRFDGSTGVL